MALNLSPRQYNIDPTGRDYILDPAPLLRAQEKNFQTQKETMNMVYETGRKGMEFVEYLGARQQLGRVKAQLSELDPNDPEFSRRLSALILDNPLALENPNTAPGLKLAIAPLAAAAQAARKHQYDMDEITASYGGRMGLQAARVQGQIAVAQDKRDNVTPTDAERMGLGGGVAPPVPEARALTEDPTPGNAFTVTPGDKLLVPVPAQPAAAQNAGAPTARPSANGNDIVFGPDDSLLPSGPTGENVPTTLPGITEAQRAAGVEQANDGTLWQRKAVGKGSSFTPYKVAPEKPTTPLPDGKEWVPELHEGTNDVKSWKAMAAPKLSAQSEAAVKAHAERIGKSDPEFVRLDTAVSEAEGAFRKAKIAYDGYSKTDPEGIKDRENMQPYLSQLAETQAKLEKQRDQRAQQIATKALEVLNPKFAENKRKFEAALSGSDPLMETPPPIVVPPITAIPAAAPAVPPTTAGKLDAALKAFK